MHLGLYHYHSNPQIWKDLILFRYYLELVTRSM